LVSKIFGQGPFGQIAASLLAGSCSGGGGSMASLGMLQSLFSLMAK
jgi:hypothetical protein